MLNFLNPYLLYIKLAICAAALVGTGWLVHSWDERGYKAAQLVAERKATAEYEKSVKAYEAKIVELQQDADEAVGKYQSRIAVLATDNQKLQRSITNATSNQPACSFTAGFGSVWNASIDKANGRVPAGTADTESAASADRGATDIDRAALLQNHDTLMQQCGRWKAQLDSIIEWDSEHK